MSTQREQRRERNARIVRDHEARRAAWRPNAVVGTNPLTGGPIMSGPPIPALPWKDDEFYKGEK